MLWLYILGLVLLVGSEINALLEHYSPHGKRKGEKEEGDRPGGSPRQELEGKSRLGTRGGRPRLVPLVLAALVAAIAERSLRGRREGFRRPRQPKRNGTERD